jgi:Fe-S oxidoreductase
MQLIRVAMFLVILGATLYLFTTAFRKRYLYLMLGAKEDRTDRPGERVKGFLKYVLGQGKVLAEPAGLGHFFIFWGFIVLSFGTLDYISYHLFGLHFMWIGDKPWFTFLHELFSALVLVAVLVALYRRYVIRPMRIEATFEAGLILMLIFLLVVTDLFTLGIDQVLDGHNLGRAAPLSSQLALLMAGAPDGVLQAVREILFWMHILVLCSFAVYIPRSKHLHMIAAMFNVYFRSFRPPGRLKKIDLEDETIEEFGVGRVEQFTWKQLLDGYACTECGRCHINCPATLSGKPLSPKFLILKMKDHLIDVGDTLLAQKKLAVAGMEGTGVEVAAANELPMLIGDVYTEEEIWSCTTCRACEEACPVFNEHVDKIIDLRRYLVMTEGKISQDVKRAFNNLERHSNEWGQSRKTRGDWAKGLNVRTMAEVDGEVEWLYYVGSAASFDQRNQKIAQAFVRLLNKAGVDFAILGEEEESDGDAARRLGNEELYQSLVQANIEIFRAYNVKKIVTTDPHAYNTFKNEYPDFGFEAEVVHATELLARLIDEGKLKPTNEVKQLITYHDSCYLGRYNGIYSAPRYILEKIPGVELVEMARNMGKSMCCGAGGGSMWKEEVGERINVMRTEQAMETGCTAIGTACPYCMTMMIDGTKAKGVEDTLPTYDVVELLDMAVS